MFPMKKLTEMPERKGIWLSDYNDIKYKTGYQWFAEFVFWMLAILFGVFLACLFWRDSAREEVSNRILALLIPAVIVAFGLFKLPGSIIYLVRRRRGEPIDIWDCETPNDPAVQERHHPTP